MEFSKLIETREWDALPPAIQKAMRYLIAEGSWDLTDIHIGLARYPELTAVLAEVALGDPRIARILELRFGAGQKL
ncbi:MAG TPA: hypothetical protein VMJ93_10840 [Verrucomicrobiae bacterium]|nr:hypothetical protein [Verrucomicrobiae bacterium]